MTIEWAAIIADNIIGYVLEQSGIGESVRNALRRNPEKQALKHALILAFEQFRQQYSETAASLFDLDFFEKEGGPIVRQFLLRNGNPNPSDLAQRWADSLNIHPSERRTIYVRELERAAADFLRILNHAIKAEPALKEINDSRSLEQTASSTTTLSTSFEIFLEAFLHKLESDKATPGTLQDYLHWLIERNLYLDPRGVLQTQRFVPVKLDEVYISLQAQRDETPDAVDRRLLERELSELEMRLSSLNLPPEEIEDLREHLLVSYHRHLLSTENSTGEVLELVEAVTCHDKLVILGDPGGGKTTLLRYLALKHAQAVQVERISAEYDLGLALFPILVRIADYAEYGLPKGKSLSDFLVDYCTMHECPGGGLADLLITKLATGNCLILLDGLDEIVNADERRSVVRRVEEFVQRHDDRANRFVITSRSAGYRSAPLGESFVHYSVQEMNEMQIRRFLERWCIAVEEAQTSDLTADAHESTARREIEGIMRAVENSRGVRRLAANPLLLRILALIHRTGAQLPQRRIELYRLTADTLARTWRMSQGVAESSLIKDEYLTPLLSKLAYWLHVNKPTGIATEREVYDVLGEEWANLHDSDWNPEKPNARIKEDVSHFLVAVREHTGLFVERAPKRYGFMHMTFEEYYAARYLVARSRTRARLIREHLHDPHWNEPILLALGFVGMESSLESSELLETAILARGKDALFFGFTPSPYEDLLGRDYLFGLRCLGEGVPVRPPLMKRLLGRLVDELLQQSGSARFWRYRQALHVRLDYLSLSDSASTFSTLMLEDAMVGDSQVRFRAAESLKRLYQTLPVELRDFESPRDIGDSSSKSSPETGAADSTAFTTLEQDTENRVLLLLDIGRAGQASPEDLSALLHTLHQDVDLAVKQAAVWSLGRAGQGTLEVVSALIDALHDSDPRIRYTSIVSLSTLGLKSSQVVESLLTTFQDIDARVRQEAVRSLGKLEQTLPEVVLALNDSMKQDSDPEVRYVAAVSLGKLNHLIPDVVLTLQQALQDARSWSTRSDSAYFLGKIDQVDEAVIESLLQGLLDEDNDVRTACVNSLVLLGRHFPDTSVSIGSKLVQVIEDPVFERLDNKLRPAHEYAFNGLWLMVVSGDVSAEQY
ncbi:MAG TPA: HEAT repeat domain-containing protein [Ktedonobacteraceae bacterium]